MKILARESPMPSAHLHLLEIVGLPRAIEGRLLGPVDAEIGEPSLAGNGLDPASFLAGRRLGTEIERDGRGPFDVLQLEQRAERGMMLPSQPLTGARQGEPARSQRET